VFDSLLSIVVEIIYESNITLIILMQWAKKS